MKLHAEHRELIYLASLTGWTVERMAAHWDVTPQTIRNVLADSEAIRERIRRRVVEEMLESVT